MHETRSIPTHRVAPAAAPPAALERAIRRQLRAMQWMTAVALVVALTAIGASCRASTASAAPEADAPTSDILRARGLVIVDEHGVERLVLGAPVPDPGSGERAAPLFGMIINDASGGERGGYGTIDADDSTILTLDDVGGTEIFKVAGNNRAGATVWVLHHEGAAAALTTYRGTPELHLLGRNDERLATLPGETPPLE